MRELEDKKGRNFMNNQIKICFIGNLSSTFIKNDYEILKEHFSVKIFELVKKKDLINYLFKLFLGIKRCDVVFCWFADWYAAFAIKFSKLLKKKSIVVVGGYDAAYEPEINYGAFTNIKEKIPAKFVLKNADLLLAVSNFTEKKILEWINPKQIKVIYNGIDTEKFKASNIKKEKLIITIGRVTKKHIKLKGLDTFAKVSTHFPDHECIIIGEMDKLAVDELKKINPKLKFTGLISQDQVKKILQRSKVYCQLSYVESFGIGVAEAMSCNCIPVVTDKGGLTEVVGDTGFYVPYNDENSTVDSIKKALNVSEGFSEKTHERIEKKFSRKEREKQLLKVIMEN